MTAGTRLKKYLEIKRIKNIHDEVQIAFAQHDLAAHSWDHIYRDTINAIWIGEAEGAAMEIVLPAILLHDIGFLHSPDPAVHNVLGAQKCVEFKFGGIFSRASWPSWKNTRNNGSSNKWVHENCHVNYRAESFDLKMPKMPKIVERTFSTIDLISNRQPQSFGDSYKFCA